MQPGTDARRRLCDRLPHADVIGRLYEWPRRQARVLIEWNHITIGQARGTYRGFGGTLLVRFDAQAAGE
jgi:hypothetical protein